MVLTRKWYPSPSYSNGSIGSNPRLLVCHTTEGAITNDSIKNYLTGHNGVSYHSSVDNYTDNVAYDYVYEDDGAWAQCNFNSVAVCCVFCTPGGASSNWSADYWRNSQPLMMHNMAKWLAEESVQHNIPLVALSSSEAQSGGRGVCEHQNLGSSGCGHTDCGNMPMDWLLELAKGYVSGQPPAAEKPPAITPVLNREEHMGAITGEHVDITIPGGVSKFIVSSDVRKQGVNHVVVNLRFHYTGKEDEWQEVRCDLVVERPIVVYSTNARDSISARLEDPNLSAGFAFA